MGIKRKLRKGFAELPIDADKEKLLSFYDPQTIESKPGRMLFKPAIALCLCLALLLGALSGAMMYAEAQEYQDAVTFFDEYGLSMEGLTRTEIKKVYRDITTGTFSYGKTAEILNTISLEIFSVELESMDPETLRALWKMDIVQMLDQNRKTGIQYRFEYLDDGKRVFRKYEDGAVIWEAGSEISDCYRHFLLKDGILVYGSSDTGTLQAVLLDDDGNIQWEYRGEETFSMPCAALSEGTVHFIGEDHRESGKTTIRLLQFDRNGSLLSKKTNTVEGFVSIRTFSVAEDHYTIYAERTRQMGIYGLSFEGELMDGELFDVNRIQLDGMEGHVMDLFYYNGQLYVSVNFLRLPFNDFYEKQFDPIYKEIWAAYDRSGYDPNYDQWDLAMDSGVMGDDVRGRFAELYRNQYTASLLQLDDSGEIQNVYTVDGAHCGELSVSEEGELLWQVNRIDSAKPAWPTISSCCAWLYVTEFAFGFQGGQLSSQTEVWHTIEGDLHIRY